MAPERNNTGRSTRFLPLIVVSSLTPLLILFLGLMVFIVPKWEKFFDDNNTPLSPAMSVLINLSKWISGRLTGQAIPGILYLFIGMIIAFWFAIAWAARHRPSIQAESIVK